MAIADFVVPSEEITLPGGVKFAVRGLSLEDVTLLLSSHGPAMEDFFRRYSGDVQANAMQVGMSLVAQAPALVAHIIAIAADEPEMADRVRKFPLTMQQATLEKIAKLTFDASGGPGKFIEAVIRLVKGTTNLLGDLKPSQIG